LDTELFFIWVMVIPYIADDMGAVVMEERLERWT